MLEKEVDVAEHMRSAIPIKFLSTPWLLYTSLAFNLLIASLSLYGIARTLRILPAFADEIFCGPFSFPQRFLSHWLKYVIS